MAKRGSAATAAVGKEPSVLTQPQFAVVSAVSELIIPRTDTPGAIDVGVPAFIDLMLKDVYGPEDRQRYLSGLAELDAASQSGEGRKFVALGAPQQVALVRKVHDAAVVEEHRIRSSHSDGPVQRPFILMTKELTLLGFFTSQVGATQVLQYAAVPGAYQACVPLEQAGNGKTWAVQPGIEF